ncbi:MAG: MoaD/ThiS family protein [Acidobacteriota bacterium]|nr:MoaD/ThiS family protein [Acidobacteriota bacterium]
MVRVHLGMELRRFTDGVAEVEVEATTVRKLISKLDELYPGIGEHLEGTAVAINGEVIADPIYETVPEAAEVHFVPAPVGG